eukprot:5341432-Pyramimonas_sp.AAC.1
MHKADTVAALEATLKGGGVTISGSGQPGARARPGEHCMTVLPYTVYCMTVRLAVRVTGSGRGERADCPIGSRQPDRLPHSGVSSDPGCV